MIQDILIFYLLWLLGAPAWCFVAICIAVLLRVINFGINIGAKQKEKP
nr:MAG TPA: Membrane bound YbgT-like protein [Bacteriophage sp.]